MAHDAGDAVAFNLAVPIVQDMDLSVLFQLGKQPTEGPLCRLGNGQTQSGWQGTDLWHWNGRAARLLDGQGWRKGSSGCIGRGQGQRRIEGAGGGGVNNGSAVKS
jgi:hypothetical protein